MRSCGILLLLLLGQPQKIDLEKLTGQSPNPENLLEKEVQTAFDLMKKEAAKDGIQISVVSGYRSFKRQTQIWNRKYKKYESQGLEPDAIFDKIVEYSTVPGTSRHHWGTDIDIIDTNASYSGDVLVPSKFHGTGPFCKLKDWMEQHASNYDFELVYTMNDNRTGFKYEPWHYSYVPLSRKRYNNYLQNIDLLSFLRSENIMGMDKISDQRIERYLEEHIKGINPILKP
ncbi:D-alanyl-D-alanine carboxypeptidase [Nonlabens dokdonensis DSW-6]|jgi:LAS superfamily LD-carboxypeptidase LdcB|uniref:D-alanyl-D-alanine carboxypeptidase n=2 Tax=Nonlabens dokdonensis TaxID=328515 RepID=L7WA48_NONDD|nr:D-alanyl-D-alanine carboxypeptidase [Nonlabens dokdonensis DSW-6]